MAKKSVIKKEGKILPVWNIIRREDKIDFSKQGHIQ